MGAVVGIRPPGAEGGDGGDDNIRVRAGQRVGGQTFRVGAVGLAVMDDHVGNCGQLPEDSPPLGVVQVEGNALLAGVQVQEQPAALRMGNVAGKGAFPPRRVAGQGRFRLDYDGAQGGQQFAAVGAGHHIRDFQDADAGQGLLGRCRVMRHYRRRL